MPGITAHVVKMNSFNKPMRLAVNAWGDGREQGTVYTRGTMQH